MVHYAFLQHSAFPDAITTMGRSFPRRTRCHGDDELCDHLGIQGCVDDVRLMQRLIARLAVLKIRQLRDNSLLAVILLCPGE